MSISQSINQPVNQLVNQSIIMSSSSSCVGVNGNGVEYQEFSCLYPALEPFYLK